VKTSTVYRIRDLGNGDEYAVVGRSPHAALIELQRSEHLRVMEMIGPIAPEEELTLEYGSAGSAMVRVIQMARGVIHVDTERKIVQCRAEAWQGVREAVIGRIVPHS
jgi:hypothetical protein